MTIHRTKSQWAEIIETYRNSGQTQSEFCRENGLNIKTLGNHLRKDNARERESARSTKEWTALIAQQKASGLSRTAWCKQNKINSDSMSNAERRIKAQFRKNPDAEWLEFNLEAKRETSPPKNEALDWGVRIRSSGLDIEVNADYDVEKLASLIGKLVQLC